VGDALGFGTEFLSKNDVAKFYPHGLSDYAQVGERFKSNEQWRPGDWTDDTDQMMCILGSLADLGRLDIFDIAVRIAKWGLSDGYGMGTTVYTCVHDPKFLTNPHEVALKYWEASGRRAAANGGVMRTSPLGVWEYQDRQKVIANAEA